MRDKLTRESLRALMHELSRSAGKDGDYRVYLVGGGTAVLEDWRASSVDADPHAPRDGRFSTPTLEKITEKAHEVEVPADQWGSRGAG